MSLLSDLFLLDDKLKFKGCNGMSAPEVTEINDIVYDPTHADVCKLDLLFKPNADGKKVPLLFNIHGGGWISGDKSFRRGFCVQFAQKGIFVININYLLGPNYRFPTYMQNIFSALRWTVDNAEKYGYDLENAYVTGDSAGAHLAACTVNALLRKEIRERLETGDADIRFKGALLYSGPFNFESFWMRFPVLDTMGRDATGVKNLFKLKNYPYRQELNPLNAVSSDFPRTLIISGIQDFVTFEQNRKLIKIFNAKGVPNEQFISYHLFNSFHCFHLKIWLPAAKRAIAKSIDFILS